VIGLGAYLCVSVALLVIGIACLLARRNILYVLMGLELILNAANINFVAFARFSERPLDGRMFAVFVIILAAAEAAVALAIILHVVGLFHSVKPSAVDRLRE
jgi:NADH-quinone oxidoreductase subunit K